SAQISTFLCKFSFSSHSRLFFWSSLRTSIGVAVVVAVDIAIKNIKHPCSNFVWRGVNCVINPCSKKSSAFIVFKHKSFYHQKH
ncbi:hypothetical protein LINPERHAP2_LOCUS11602, partial [Linum perenne]